MFIIKYKNIFLGITTLLIVGGIVAIGVFGLKQGIDFTGGSILELSYPAGTRPDLATLKSRVNALNLGQSVLQPVDQNDLIIRTRSITEQERVMLVTVLSVGDAAGTSTASSSIAQVKNFNSIGPVIGSELKQKSIYALALVIALIMAYITFVFRHVSRPVASWKYGLIAVITLVHDVIVPTGLYALYGHYTGAEVDVLFVTALLAILGFSIHDTIVVFDRIRENLRIAPSKELFSDTVGKSLNQTFTRSINTSLTVILTLLVLYFIGGESTKNFSLLLLVGIVAGTYSSVFFASPLLVEFERWQKKK